MTRFRTLAALVAVSAVALPASAATALAPVSAGAAVPVCSPGDLHVGKGHLEGAAGSRFQTVRVTNTSAEDCSTTGLTRYRFRSAHGPIGYKSTRNPGAGSGGRVVIEAGHTARSVLSWVDPGPTVPSQCRAGDAVAFRMTINDVDAYFRLPLAVNVCTTRKYRPHGTRLSVR
ncbi:MAG: hypothetical protein JWN22_271 [Nocardioides sp.]|jgi:hypothetical protein|nr:hypothetical protein [Nocardioides sp.]